MNLLLKCFALVLTGLLGAKAYADPINVTFWSVPATTADEVPTIGHVPGPGATEWGTFTTNTINFSADTGPFTVGNFLAFGGVTSVDYMNGASGSSSIIDVLFDFTGTAFFTNGQTFSVVHDDGLDLYVGGNLVEGLPDETPPITSTFTYTGPTGNEPFEFIYADGPPTQADFKITLVPAASDVPEPSSIALLGSGILGMAGVIRCRFNK
jgi:hypothetical protein